MPRTKGPGHYWSGTPGSNRRLSPWQCEALYPHGRSVLLIHAMTAARRAAWSGIPSALARFSRCLQTLAGKRTERGTVGPVSVPPGPAPTNVDGDPLRRDSKGVWIATDLGLVEVHLGHFAQRRAGWAARLLTNRLLHSASFRGT